MTYRSYMLRLWHAGDGDDPLWRASLENSQTGERFTFASLEEMFDYLVSKLKNAKAPDCQGSTAAGQRGPPMSKMS